MDTIIFLAHEHEIYVGDYYKDKLKEVKFEKADTWEVYAYEDFERLLEYMQYPLKYNHFKNNRLIFLFDDIRFYEWIQRAERLLQQSESIYVHRIEPFIEKLKEERVVEVYEEILKYNWEQEEPALRYRVVLCPATLYTTKQDKKAFLHTEDLLDEASLIQEGTKVQKGDEILGYEHHVQKLFGRTTVERLTKKASDSGCFYWYLKGKEGRVWARKDEVIGIIDCQEGIKEDMLNWCKKMLL